MLTSRLLNLTRGLVVSRHQQQISRLLGAAAALSSTSGASSSDSPGTGTGANVAMPKKTKAGSPAAGDGEAAAASPPVSPRKRARRSADPASPAAASPPAASPKRKSPLQRVAESASPSRKSGRIAAAAEKASQEAAVEAKEAEEKKEAAKSNVQLKKVPGPRYTVSMRPPRLADPALSVMSWNVAGLRSLLKKDAGAVKKLVELEGVDVMCLQETKLQDNHVDKVIQELGLNGWSAEFNCSTAKKGYSGVATLCRVKPISSSCGIGVPEHDDEGRVVTVELPDYFVVNAYVPNSGDGLKRLDYRLKGWDVAFSDYIGSLEARGKPVIVVGDLNCAHHPIDIHSPATNLKSAGFTPEERESFGRLLVAPDGLLVDTFRAAHPGVVGYTYYSYRFNARAKGAGWRLDYCLVSKSLADRVHDSYILPEFTGSDHVPLGVVIKKP